MRISDWSSDVCSSDLRSKERIVRLPDQQIAIHQTFGHNLEFPAAYGELVRKRSKTHPFALAAYLHQNPYLVRGHGDVCPLCNTLVGPTTILPMVKPIDNQFQFFERRCVIDRKSVVLGRSV